MYVSVIIYEEKKILNLGLLLIKTREGFVFKLHQRRECLDSELSARDCCELFGSEKRVGCLR